MALVKCRECEREVSSSAKVCPGCGIKHPQPINWIAWGCLIGAFLFLLLIGGIRESFRDKPKTTGATKAYFLEGVPYVKNDPFPDVKESTPATETEKEETLQSITVRGKEIRVGDTFDHVLTILKNSDQVGQEVSSNDRGSLLLWKRYKVAGKKFTLTVSRTDDPGPYRIIKIKEGS